MRHEFTGSVTRRLSRGAQAVIQVVRRWNEAWGLVLLLVAWPVTRWGPWLLDPGTPPAPIDASSLTSLYVGLLGLMGLHLAAWVGLRLNLPVVWRFWEYDFERVFKTLTWWQQCCFALACLALYWLLAVWCWQIASHLAT